MRFVLFTDPDPDDAARRVSMSEEERGQSVSGLAHVMISRRGYAPGGRHELRPGTGWHLKGSEG